jgi:hypothetical protein
MQVVVVVMVVVVVSDVDCNLHVCCIYILVSRLNVSKRLQFVINMLPVQSKGTVLLPCDVTDVYSERNCVSSC